MGRARELNFSPLIEKRVREAAAAGVSIKDLLASISHLQQAPRSTAQLYKYYGQAIAEERVKVTTLIGSKVISQAMEGDFKSQELYLKSKGGWSPSNTVNLDEIDGNPDEDTSAIDALMTLLGKGTKKEQ